MKRSGLTLLEVLVALVIFGMFGVAYVQLLGDSMRVADSTRTWSRAVAYAEDAIEEVKRAGISAGSRRPERLDGGFARFVETRSWDEGVVRVTAVVTLPGGGRMELDRLVEFQ